MRLTAAVFFTLLLIALLAPGARAEDHVSGIPNFHADYPSLSIQQYLLGNTCLSLQGSPLELSCNPAFLANEKKHQVRLNLAFNDHVLQVNEYRERLATGDQTSIVNKILDKREPVVARATSAAWYQRDFWAMGYVPFRGGFATLVQNDSYPRISAHIYKESELFGKVGFAPEFDKNLQVGLQVRYIDRVFFRKEFDLLDALADPSQLRIESQKIIYVEPGLSYSFDAAWASAVSATVTQLPVMQQGYASTFTPILDVGFSTAPPFAGSKLRTSTHYNSNAEQSDLFSRFRWGAIYDLDDIGSVTLSLGKSLAGIGVSGHYDSVTLGLGYKTEDISPDQWQSIRVSTVLFEGGLVF
jgi:hypothetical protein